MRQNYRHFVTTCAGGIDQQSEKAGKQTCADARNVWAPDGRVVQRPGYLGLLTMPTSAGLTVTNMVGRAYDVSGSSWASQPAAGGVLALGGLTAAIADPNSDGDLSDAVAGDLWYVGHANKFFGCLLEIADANTAATHYKAEYWNGAIWKFLNVFEVNSASFSGTGNHLSVTPALTGEYFLFVPPSDWAVTDVDTVTDKYWLRFTLQEVDTIAAVNVDLGGATNSGYWAAGDSTTRGIFSAQFATTKRYIYVLQPSTTSLVFHNSDTPYLTNNVQITETIVGGPEEPATIAVVPDFEEAYIAYANSITVHKAYPASTDTIAAAVESRDFAVGDGAPYDPSYIVQEAAFPQAKYVAYFDQRLWFTGIKDDPFGIRWSAPSPYYKVLPSLSREVLMEDDNSPITGMAALGEHMVVFKQDSIWLMVDNGLDAFDLRQYVPKRVVAGVGCVANGSIQKVRGNLIFLAEDGVYAFDGTPNIKKISDPLNDTMAAVDPGYRAFASSVHWREKNLYLLNVSTDGAATNDLTLAFDYKNGSWWIWNTIEAQHWMSDEDTSDRETLYFGDSSGSVFQFGVGKMDNEAAISSYVTTQRFSDKVGKRLRLREVNLTSINQASSVTIEPLVNDEYSGQSGITGTLDLSDTNESSSWRERRRDGHINFKRDFDWVQCKVSHGTKNAPFKLSEIDMAWLSLGRRG